MALAFDIKDGDNRQYLDPNFSTGSIVFGGSRALGTGSTASTDQRASTSPLDPTGEAVNYTDWGGIVRMIVIGGGIIAALFALVYLIRPPVRKPAATAKKKGKK